MNTLVFDIETVPDTDLGRQIGRRDPDSVETERVGAFDQRSF